MSNTDQENQTKPKLQPLSYYFRENGRSSLGEWLTGIGINESFIVENNEKTN